MAEYGAKKKASNRNWDKQNMAKASCSLKKQDYEDFKQYASERGTSVHALLKAYVLECIGKTEE